MQRVNLTAFLQACRVLLDVIASYVSLYVLDWGLIGVGIGTILASITVATAAFACILLLPPPEGRHKIHIFTPLLKGVFGGAKSEPVTQTLSEPLLSGVEEGETLKSPVQALGRRGEESDGGVGEEPVALDPEEEERINAVLNESTWKFVWDGLSTMLRSALVQVKRAVSGLSSGCRIHTVEAALLG